MALEIYRGFANALGESQKPPRGEIKISSTGGGFFWTPFSREPSEAEMREWTFALFPEKEDRIDLYMAKKFPWALPESIFVTSIKVIAGKNAAVITTIQPVVDYSKLNAKVKRKYRNGHLATAIAAASYCRAHGIRLYAVDPKNYRDLHHQSGTMGGEIAGLFGKTLANLSMAIGNPANGSLHLVETDAAIGPEFTKHFGARLVTLL